MLPQRTDAAQKIIHYLGQAAQGNKKPDQRISTESKDIVD